MTPYVILSSILFTIGSVGVLTRRNAIVVFMMVELMLNASNLALVAFANQNGNLDGQVAAQDPEIRYALGSSRFVLRTSSPAYRRANSANCGGGSSGRIAPAGK